MTPNAITLALIARLKSSNALSFVNDNNVFEGVREGITNFPCIVVESDGDQVVEYVYPYERIIQKFKVGGFIDRYDKNHQLTDDGTNKGLLTLKNAIKLALSADDDLGLDNVYSVQMPRSQDDNTNYPVRGFTIAVEVLYRQDRKTRA